MNITEANKILTSVRKGTAKKDGYTAQQIKDAKARMAEFNAGTSKDRTYSGGSRGAGNYNKGGYANCGASVPPAQGKK